MNAPTEGKEKTIHTAKWVAANIPDKKKRTLQNPFSK
jgi:hypothetical protein